MKTLLVVMAVAATVLLIKPNKIVKEEAIQVPKIVITDSAKAAAPTQTVNKLTLNMPQVLILAGEVNGVSSASVIRGIKALQANKAPIYLLIDSPGGSVLDGAQVLSAIEASKVPVNTVCMRMCASMAFVIHQFGTKRLAVSRSILMAHPASGGVNPGQIQNMLNLLKTITNYIDKMDAFIAKRAGLGTEEFHAMIAHELWLDAEDATARRFNDEIVYITNDLNESATPVNTDERLRNIRR